MLGLSQRFFFYAIEIKLFSACVKRDGYNCKDVGYIFLLAFNPIGSLLLSRIGVESCLVHIFCTYKYFPIKLLFINVSPILILIFHTCDTRRILKHLNYITSNRRQEWNWIDIKTHASYFYNVYQSFIKVYQSLSKLTFIKR